MKQLQVMLEQQETLLKLVRHACESKLYDCSVIMPELEEKIIANMRWGLFMPERTPSSLLAKIGSAHSWSEDTYADEQDLLRINFAEITLVEDFIKSQPGLLQRDIFSPKLSLKDKQVEVTFIRDGDYTTICKEVSDIPIGSLESILEVYHPRLTLPDYDFIWPEYSSIMDIPDWELQYVSLYEEFQWQSDNKDGYIQIGGHGRWIQGSYPDTYIAQVNNDVGDAGAVFIQYTDGKFDGWVDMH